MEESSNTWLTPVRESLAVLRLPTADAGGSARLLEALGRLDDLVAQYRGEMPADLVHYLERRSYDKAAQWCAGAGEIKRGSCGTKV
jgi:hypothetical protein